MCLNTHTCDVTQHSHSYAHVRTCRWHKREQDLPEEGEEVHDVAATPRRLLDALFFISTIYEQTKSSSDESVRIFKYRAVNVSVEKIEVWQGDAFVGEGKVGSTVGPIALELIVCRF